MFYYYSYVSASARVKHVALGIVSRDSVVDGDWLRATNLCHRYDMIIRSYGSREKFAGGLLVQSVHLREKTS